MTELIYDTAPAAVVRPAHGPPDTSKILDGTFAARAAWTHPRDRGTWAPFCIRSAIPAPSTPGTNAA
jgi:hypothetical protein